MTLADIQTQLNNLKTLVPALTNLGTSIESLLNPDQKAALDKVVTSLQAIPIVEIENTLTNTYDTLQKDITLSKAQLIIAGAGIALFVHLLHNNKS